MAGAKFCVECGRALAGPASQAGDSAPSEQPQHGGQPPRMVPITSAFVAVFAAITVVGLAAAGWIVFRTPAVVRQRVSSEGAIAEQNPMNPSGASNSLSGTAGNNAPNQLPQGHPRVQLPTEARTFIDKVEQEAKAKPNDISVWNRLGSITMRAAMFDESYNQQAEDAYGHVLKLDPDNLEALRGIGDIYYDTSKYDEAIAAYEHYLKKKPDDPEVSTDLGTMYLYTGNADQALVQYQRALRIKPDMFQAYYNMGVAYAEEGKPATAQAALKKALDLAPDDNARNQIKDIMAKIAGGEAATLASTSGGGASAANDSGANAAQAQSAVTPATTFQGDIEQIVRGLPIAGPKVGSVSWPDKTNARVVMNNFPMDQMPPFAKQKFLTDLKSGIDNAKKDYKVKGAVRVDIVDGASGRVMETVTD